jgi:membrane peptidoglycan carboxypeptidase
MSDSNDNLWKQPQQTGGWREPEENDENPSWRRVRALPDLDEQPEQAGGWHRPDQQDTTFSPEDTLDIAVHADEASSLPEDAETIAPEDVVASATPVDDILPPEDMLDQAGVPATAIVPQPVLAPEDYIYQLEHAEDDDFDKLGMSELVALASLNQAKTDGESLSPDLALGNETAEDDINIEMLSPAERMLLNVDSSDTEEIEAEVVDDENDPTAYARRQMESLIQSSDAVTDVIGEDDPASYARRQMEALMNETGVGSATAPIPPSAPVEELSPRDIDLLRRYREAEAAVKNLRQQYNAGAMDYDGFVAQLQNHMILDDDQVWWMMGVQTDQWYYADSSNQWVEGQPEVFAKEQRVKQQSYSPTQDSGSFGSLPYIPDQQPTHGEYTPPQDQYEMPLPRSVPIDDFDATVPSAAAYRMDQAASYADTVPSSAHVDQTVMAQPVGYGTIESPYDQTEPPDYDYDEDGEVFEKARERARRSSFQTFSLFGALAIGLLLLVAGAYIGMAVLWYQNLANEWEVPVANLATLDQGTTFQPLVLLDRDGEQIAEISLGGDVRRPVEIEDVSPYFIHAILSLKDPNFYDEQEWSFTTRLGAYWNNLTSGTPNIQASPLTMEIARSLVLRDRVYDTPEERLRDELIVANELTRTYSRAQLLEFYMNDVLFFGNQNYGVEAATRFYFERDTTVRTSADLTYPQAALLAVVSQSPADLDPISNREVALDQMRATMQKMAEVGCITFTDRLPAGGQRQLCISPSDFTSGESALNQSRVVRFLRTQLRDSTTDYPHFVTLVQNQLQAVYGDDIYRRGYRVTTTLDRSTQNHAERALVERVNLLRGNGVDTGAVMVTDPRNGAILALVGSPDYDDESVGGQEDKGRTYRLPGDVIKPLVYAMAFDGIDLDGSGTYSPNEYITPATILWDVPTTFSDGTPIQNAGNAINGAVSARFALGNTLNIPIVKLFADFGGAERFRMYAERLGIRFSSNAQIRADAALGTTEVRLYDLMKMYGVIANNGNLHALYTVESITDSNGNQIPVAPELKPEVERVITEEIAYLLQSILSDDSARQPRYPAGSPLTIPNVRVGAISGTTPGSSDLWTMGFTTNRVVGVWLGNNGRDTVLNNMTGFQAAAPLWNEIMRNTIAGTQVGSFQRPANILQAQGCADTGTVPAGNNCPRIANIEFISSRRPPTPEQSFLVTVEVDTWSGLIANQNCSENRTTRQFVNIPDPTALNWINNTQQGRAYAQRIGLPIPAVPAPTQGCDLNVVIPTANITAPQGSQTIQDDIVIYGQVSQEEFLRYEVQIAPAGTENYQTIVTSTTPQPMANSPLATWDTTSVTNGRYTIRLAVFSNNANNGYVYRTVSDIIVNNPEPTPTPIPTATMTPIPTDPPLVIDPLPIDPLPLDPLPFEPLEGQPTPTIDPFG